MKITKTFLEHSYLTDGKSGYQIAKELSVPKHTVDNLLTKFKIKRRPLAESRANKNSKKIQGHKWCNACKTDKEFANFSRDKRSRDGYEFTCKKCKSGLVKKYYPMRGIQRIKVKAELIIEFGNACLHCKLINLPIACYVFHHHSEKMSTKDYMQPARAITSKNKKTILMQKSKWILLCANCHNLNHSKFKVTANDIIKQY